MSKNIENNSAVCCNKKLNNEDIISYKKTVQEALKVLNKKNLSIIIHGSSFPSAPSKDTGIGSPNSEGAMELMDFISGIFNSIQLGPSGKTKGIDPSPYTSTTFSNNTLFIDLAPLTTAKYGELLSSQTFENIVKNNPNSDKNKVAYEYIYVEQDKALREAFNTFKAKLEDIKNLSKTEAKTIKAINTKFTKFKKENNYWLEKDSMYEALSVKNSNDYWPVWNDELDKNLYNPKNKEEEKASKQRIKEIKKDYSDEIEFYSFTQFIANEQKEEIKEFALKNDIKMIADRQVGFSERDFWGNQSLFLKDWLLGCPPDYFSEDGQAWGLPVLDPEKLFDKNGNLAEGGLFLKSVFKKIYKENPGGVRIDHIIGLIDPWVYKAGKMPKSKQGAGRLYSSPEHPELSKYSIIGSDSLDKELEPEDEKYVIKLSDEQIERYAQVMNKIVIAAAEEEGIEKDSIICEDLGTLTFPVINVLEKMGLSGLRVTEFIDPEVDEHPYRGVNVKPRHWIVTGTHDNDSLISWAKDLYKDNELLKLHIDKLAKDLIPEEDKRGCFAEKLANDPMELVKAKFVELFASPSQNVQIFFPDVFGIKERYNKPGTPAFHNWALRIPNDFEKFYLDHLSKNKGLNLPEVLKLAIEAKGSDFAAKNKELVDNLEKYSQIFKN